MGHLVRAGERAAAGDRQAVEHVVPPLDEDRQCDVAATSCREIGHLGDRGGGSCGRGDAQEPERGRPGAVDDDVCLEGGSVGGPHGDGIRRLAQRRHAPAGVDLEATRLLQRVQALVGSQHARAGFDQHHVRRGDPGKAPGGRAGRDLLDGGTGRLQGAGDGVQCGLVTQRHLAGDIEELATGRRLEVAPTSTGQHGHLDVVGLGVTETEDAGVAFGPRTLVAGRAGRLEDHDVPAPPGQGPGGGKAEQSRADHDAAAVVGHALDLTNAPSRASSC